MYIFGWYLLVQIFETKYDRCLHTKESRKLYFLEQLTRIISVILIHFSFFCRKHTIIFCLVNLQE
jgi:hypothetical protein